MLYRHPWSPVIRRILVSIVALTWGWSSGRHQGNAREAEPCASRPWAVRRQDDTDIVGLSPRAQTAWAVGGDGCREQTGDTEDEPWLSR